MAETPARRRPRRRILALATGAGVWVTASVLAPTAVPRSVAAVVTASAASAGTQDGLSDAALRDLVSAMTLAEKVAMIQGATDPKTLGEAGYLAGVPRLGIPALRLSDGPAGIRVSAPATALPAPVALGATFSADLAAAYGGVLGRDAASRGIDVLLGPMLNVIRTPQGGRNFETLSEDPYLTATMAGPEVQAIQRRNVIATAKHYAENNQETGRMGIDVTVDEQALHEVELPGFESAVAAGAHAVMCAYNRVNGAYSCDSRTLLSDVLRARWGFDGIVMSDWGATHSTAPALNAGQNMDMPGTWRSQFTLASISAALADGTLSRTVLDHAVHGVLVAMNAVGLLANATPSGPRSATWSIRRIGDDPAADADVAEQVARSGAVLLRNQNGTLPLAAADLDRLAVIGPTAKTPLVGGGGSSHVVPVSAESPLAALQRRAGPHARITYTAGQDNDGVAIPSTALPGGLNRSEDVSGTSTSTATDVTLDFTGAAALPGGKSYRWTGTLSVPSSGDYDLKLQASANATTALNVDGTNLTTTGGFFSGASLLPTADGLLNGSKTVHLAAGPHPVAVTATAPAGGPLQIRLAWLTPGGRQQAIDASVTAARSARTVVLFAYDEGTEGSDRRTLALPGYQEQLISAVTAVNHRTVVVLNTGSALTMPWLDGTAAVLDTWYPGQQGASATADLLLGRANPAGKLPLTFPASTSATPTSDPRNFPGVDTDGDGTPDEQTYTEGINVGYRWYAATGTKPLFPFGYGLSYTRFGYSGLSVRAQGNDGYEVTFTVTNTGSRAGTEVPQVYLGRGTSVHSPALWLAGYGRVTLAPYESRQMRLHIALRSLSYWSTSSHDWRVADGDHPLTVGSSSADVRLRTSLRVGAR